MGKVSAVPPYRRTAEIAHLGLKTQAGLKADAKRKKLAADKVVASQKDRPTVKVSPVTTQALVSGSRNAAQVNKEQMGQRRSLQTKQLRWGESPPLGVMDRTYPGPSDATSVEKARQQEQGRRDRQKKRAAGGRG